MKLKHSPLKSLALCLLTANGLTFSSINASADPAPAGRPKVDCLASIDGTSHRTLTSRQKLGSDTIGIGIGEISVRVSWISQSTVTSPPRMSDSPRVWIIQGPSAIENPNIVLQTTLTSTERRVDYSTRVLSHEVEIVCELGEDTATQ
jgi:hypothetical protein